jgi:NADH-quinone oxidoreductase subunit L
MTVSGIAAIVMAIWAYRKYVTNASVPKEDRIDKGFLGNLSYHKFYVDEIYDALVVKPLDSLSVFFYRIVDRKGIDGIVNGIANGFNQSGKGIRLLQGGNVGLYIFLMVIGIVAIFIYGLYII